MLQRPGNLGIQVFHRTCQEDSAAGTRQGRVPIRRVSWDACLCRRFWCAARGSSGLSQAKEGVSFVTGAGVVVVVSVSLVPGLSHGSSHSSESRSSVPPVVRLQSRRRVPGGRVAQWQALSQREVTKRCAVNHVNHVIHVIHGGEKRESRGSRESP